MSEKKLIKGEKVFWRHRATEEYMSGTIQYAGICFLGIKDDEGIGHFISRSRCKPILLVAPEQETNDA